MALTSDYALLPSESDAHNDSALDSTKRNTGKLASFQFQLSGLYNRNIGLLSIVASQVFLALVNVAVKQLNVIDPPVPTFELILIRMAITYLFSVTYMKFMGVDSPFLGPKGVRLLLMFRGFVGFFGIFGIYFALKYLSLSDATVLTFLAPLCTSITGALFLGEYVGRKEIFAGVFSLVGVIFIARPTSLFGHSHIPIINGTVLLGNSTGVPLVSEALVNLTSLSNDTLINISNSTLSMLPPSVTPTKRLIAVGVSLLGVMGATGAYTTIRAIGTRAHALHSMAAYSSISVVVSAIGLIATHTPIVIPTSPIWLLLLLEIGVFGFCAQIFLTLGLQRETASRGTLAIYTLIVFTSLLDRIFFHAVPSLLSIMGTVIIVGSALYVAVTKQNQNESEPSKGNVNARRSAAGGHGVEQEILLKNMEEGGREPAIA
ncbi:hypothetical protein BDP27DRAFT_462995 [Rhodocollybia butyracea]|uniref:EamA domain-containing protein n=1 Tax=Rhodocollybia butyracea TaxID=206335 RepID=A0A9P5UAD2_9AGAR|nr:hypothetical protein BDP27DRAFT_462995 [Rhodocollybia butyracea]